MKKLLFILFICPLASYGQQPTYENPSPQPIKVEIQNKTNPYATPANNRTTVNPVDYNVGRAAAAAAAAAPSTKVITPLEVDLYEYTHIAMVDMNHCYFGRKKKSYNWFEKEVLMSSPLSIINPTSEKKKFKKNPLYLRNVKNESWTYLYVTNTTANSIDFFTTIILRDSKNKILYKADYVNVLLPQSLEFLVGF